ncbi:vp39 [Peridroma alphabaculovirus]|uniref:Vp39 n=1 Tax=Peridroma alphabaculovirus TaxID=1346829 RepID=A0A068LKA4_9ABAC|nr:vp39 [Peridroma alphabaculovirus]AIE47799.1 vp39 [Peridroma alphabaculovirus]
MALAPTAATTNRLRNYCILGAVQPFDNCRTYGSPCSPDKVNDDGWYICEYHASIRFKIEKMNLPIPDGEGNLYNRTIGKSLVSDKAEGIDRILIPTRANYETVLKINSMSLPEQLIFHMIYDDREKQERVCQMLRYNENFETDIFRIVEEIYNKTAMVLALTDPNRYCSRVSQNSSRVYGVNDDVDVAEQVVNELPGFLKNLVNKCVAPETMVLENQTLQFRNCPTCRIDGSGLVADVKLYNPIEPKYRSGYNDNFLQIENVLKFRGNANALQKSLARYEPYPVVVPLFLGSEVVVTANSLKPVPLTRILPTDQELPPNIPVVRPMEVVG